MRRVGVRWLRGDMARLNNNWLLNCHDEIGLARRLADGKLRANGICRHIGLRWEGQKLGVMIGEWIRNLMVSRIELDDGTAGALARKAQKELKLVQDELWCHAVLAMRRIRAKLWGLNMLECVCGWIIGHRADQERVRQIRIMREDKARGLKILKGLGTKWKYEFVALCLSRWLDAQVADEEEENAGMIRQSKIDFSKKKFKRIAMHSMQAQLWILLRNWTENMGQHSCKRRNCAARNELLFKVNK